MKRLAVIASLIALPSFAVAPGGPLYAKCNPTKVLKKASASAANQSSLNVGDEVTWLAADAKPYHKVKAKGAEGYVDQTCLSPSKPAPEYAGAGGAAISSSAFKSSGAATKGLSDGAITYANEKGPDKAKVAAQLIYVEENTRHSTEPGDKGFVEWAKKQGVNFAAGKEAHR